TILFALLLAAACSQSPRVPTSTIPAPGEITQSPTLQAPTEIIPAALPTATMPHASVPTVTVDSITPPAIVPERFFDAQEGVAMYFDIPIDQVRLISTQSVEWPNSCLGVSQPGVQCQQVITPGYRLVFEIPSGTVEVHTNQDGTGYRILDPKNR
ncbi:MAG: hypothetical protein ACWGO1_11380, partial [Anaerolineales bacterium]